MSALRLFVEAFTLAAFAAVVVHAGLRRGAAGLGFLAALAWLGFARENAVALAESLYTYGDLRFALGKAPAIAAVIWAFSIRVASVWTERVAGVSPERDAPSARTLLAPALFMAALAGFYEPFLERMAMARWEPGTLRLAGVPCIALVGYPTLTAAFLLVWSGARRLFPGALPRAAALAVALPALGLAHAAGLLALKRLLGW